MTIAGGDGLTYDPSARWYARAVRAEAEKIRTESRRMSAAAALVEAQFAATMQRLADAQPDHAKQLRALSSAARLSAEKRWQSMAAGRASVTVGHGQPGDGDQPPYGRSSTQLAEDATPADLPGFASAGTAEEAHQRRELELLGRIVNNLLFAALHLRGGIGTGDQVPADRVAEALQWVDDSIRQVRGHVVSAHPGMPGQMSGLPPPNRPAMLPGPDAAFSGPGMC